MNITSSSSISAAPPTNSSIASLYLACQNSIGTKVINTTVMSINIFLLPFYIFILHMGVQRWRRRRSASAATTLSHSDFFTYNMMIVEILCVSGSVFYTLGLYIKQSAPFMLGVYLFRTTLLEQSLFHSLTCVERYLAVVHPITYMRFREASLLRIRNISTVCVWLFCFGFCGLVQSLLSGLPGLLYFSFISLSILVIFFCCVSVLCALTRPGPGKVAGTEERVDQSKQRAFHMMMAITGALLLRFVGLMVSSNLEEITSMDPEVLCALIDSCFLLMIPSSLVLPLLFLHRAGKLPCCRRNSESG